MTSSAEDPRIFSRDIRSIEPVSKTNDPSRTKFSIRLSHAGIFTATLARFSPSLYVRTGAMAGIWELASCGVVEHGYETGRPGFDSGLYPNKSEHAPRSCALGKEDVPYRHEKLYNPREDTGARSVACQDSNPEPLGSESSTLPLRHTTPQSLHVMRRCIPPPAAREGDNVPGTR
ncbi:hypothetical protein Bbelb_309770 [Branchiostoma belcheri]|nr:hypothetical protein Bbelb_309770 [Branchiostoma belcheri]